MKKLDEENNSSQQENISERAKMKGVRSNLCDFHHADYLKFLLGSKKFFLHYCHKSFVTKKHRVFLRSAQKIVTGRQIQKRFLMPDEITCLPFGHVSLPIFREVWSLLDDMISLIDK